MAQIVRNLPEPQKTWIQSLGQEDPMDGGAWQAAVHAITKSQTQLND